MYPELGLVGHSAEKAEMKLKTVSLKVIVSQLEDFH